VTRLRSIWEDTARAEDADDMENLADLENAEE
jgi:hypothetical protein